LIIYTTPKYNTKFEISSEDVTFKGNAVIFDELLYNKAVMY